MDINLDEKSETYNEKSETYNEKSTYGLLCFVLNQDKYLSISKTIVLGL
jgi:hypothetical protein